MRKLLALAFAAILLPSTVLAQAGAQLGAGQVWGNSTAARAPGKSETITAILDRALGSTRGAIIERGASGWGIVGPSATAGLAWISGGTGADPAYGILGLSGGGCNAALTASNGGILYSTASACAILGGTATARQMLQSGASGAPAWSTTTWPATTTINRILYSSSASVIGEIATANNGLLGTNGSGVPSVATLAGDCTFSTPNITCQKINGVAFAASPSTDTIPVITAANTATYTSVPNCTSGSLQYATATHLFSCGGAGSGTVTNVATAGMATGGPITTTGTVTVTAATQSDQETATSTVNGVTPGRQQFHPSAAKAWAYMTVSGSACTIQANYNAPSCTWNSVGNITLNFNTAFSSAAFSCTVTATYSAATLGVAMVSGQATGTVTFINRKYDDSVNLEAPGYRVTCFGDQ